MPGDKATSVCVVREVQSPGVSWKTKEAPLTSFKVGYHRLQLMHEEQTDKKSQKYVLLSETTNQYIGVKEGKTPHWRQLFLLWGSSPLHFQLLTDLPQATPANKKEIYDTLSLTPHHPRSPPSPLIVPFVSTRPRAMRVSRVDCHVDHCLEHVTRNLTRLERDAKPWQWPKLNPYLQDIGKTIISTAITLAL